MAVQRRGPKRPLETPRKLESSQIPHGPHRSSNTPENMAPKTGPKRARSPNMTPRRPNRAKTRPKTGPNHNGTASRPTRGPQKAPGGSNGPHDVNTLNAKPPGAKQLQRRYSWAPLRHGPGGPQSPHTAPS
eukprot:3725460-Pyramimonas_sp.AAC.1